MHRFMLTSGTFADTRQLEDLNYADIQWMSGPHAGHLCEVRTWKANCGASGHTCYCECGKEWFSCDQTGCWQEGHNFEPSGDAALKVAW